MDVSCATDSVASNPLVISTIVVDVLGTLGMLGIVLSIVGNVV